MKNFKNVTLAALAAVTLVTPVKALEVQTHTASPAGFSVNSHLILGKKDAILVDAQFTRSEARKVVEMIQKSGRNLVTIFITHGHPDHYFGLEILKQAFPQAKAIAYPEVIEDIQKTAADKQKYWKAIYKDDLTDVVVVPEPTQAKELLLDGESLPIVEIGPGESEHAAVVLVPSLKTLISGDLAFNQIHLWLAENRPENWLQNLDVVGKLARFDRVLPGHGVPGTSAILDEDREYIERFLDITDSTHDAKEALEQLKAAYPNYGLPIIAELSVQARVK